MRDSLAPWKLLGRGALIARLAAIGAVAGVASWALTIALQGRFGSAPPEAGLLSSAVLKGIVVGTIFAVVLHAWWHRNRL